MELKVWVDGIQRVVCGANYATTCQDVVLALAHAMGRTGRFTLVEKWRDTERPLTPGECPLQALHKWGEYAAEVKFFLVQAETERVRQKSQSNWPEKEKASAQKRDEFGHGNNTLTPASHQRRTPINSASESIKRSSTFSGAHNSPNFTLPSHNPSSSSSSLPPGMNLIKPQPSHHNQRGSHSSRPPSSQHQYQNQLHSLSEYAPSIPRSNSQTRQQQQQHQQQQQQQQVPYSSATLPSSFNSRHHLQNGDVTSALSSTSSSSSSPRSSSQTRTTTPRGFAQIGAANVSGSHPTESRHQLHPGHSSVSSEGRSDRSPTREHRRGRATVTSPQQQHYHQQPVPGQPTPSFPTPAPRGQRQRASPASPNSQQYENLPPARRSRESLSPGQLSSNLQVSRQRRRSPSGGRQSSNDEHPSQRNNNITNTQPSRDGNVFNGKPDTDGRREDLRDGRSDSTNNSGESHRKDFPGSYDARTIEKFAKPGASVPQPDRTVRVNTNSRHVQDSTGLTVPTDNTDSRPLPVDSLSPKHSLGLPTKSVSHRPSDSGQPAVKSPTSSVPYLSNTLERSRRSHGDKVSFVESAFLKQRSSRDVQSTSTSSSSSSTPLRQDQNALHDADRHQKKERHSSNHLSQSSDYADPRFMPQDGQPGVSRSASSVTSSYQPVLPQPTTGSSQPQFPNSASNPVLVPQQPNNTKLLTSPRRHSAFKEVSPRSSRPNSSSSPGTGESPLTTTATPTAYNLDDHNFDHYPGVPPLRLRDSGSVPNPGLGPVSVSRSNSHSHSRQASLEIEEYNLDHNFPDVFAKEASFPSGPPGSSSSNGHHGQTHTEYFMDRQTTTTTSEMEPEYMHLLRKVNMQQEMIKIAEAQTNEISTEIEALEVDESNLTVKLETVISDLESYGEKEEAYHLELEELGHVEWVTVLEEELRCELDLKKQISHLKDGLSKFELQMEDVKQTETTTKEEIEQEEEKIAQETAKAEKETEEINTQTQKAEAALRDSEELLAKRKEVLDDILTKIDKIEKDLEEQETEASKLECDLHDENLKDFHAHPVPKEPVPLTISSTSDDLEESPPVTPNTPLAAGTGEAILKILEEGRSPRTSPAMEDESGGIASAQHMSSSSYKSPMAAKNPNGIWV